MAAETRSCWPPDEPALPADRPTALGNIHGSWRRLNRLRHRVNDNSPGHVRSRRDRQVFRSWAPGYGSGPLFVSPSTAPISSPTSSPSHDQGPAGNGGGDGPVRNSTAHQGSGRRFRCQRGYIAPAPPVTTSSARRPRRAIRVFSIGQDDGSRLGSRRQPPLLKSTMPGGSGPRRDNHWRPREDDDDVRCTHP